MADLSFTGSLFALAHSPDSGHGKFLIIHY
jgi:hypothetical protein